MQQKIKELSHKNTKVEFFKYILVGIITNIGYYGAFLISMYVAKLHYSISVILSYSLSILIGYSLNSKFSFKVMYKTNLLKYIILYSSSMLLNIFILFILIDFYKLEAWVSQSISTLFIVLFNFTGLKFYVYQTKHVY